MRKHFLTCCLLAAVLAFSACSNSGNNTESSDSGRPKGTKIVIYAGGSSEFSWTEGSEEQYVIDYIEDKYYQETGVSLDFEIAYLGENMRTKLTSELAGGSQVDIVVSHTRGGVGIDDYVIQQGIYYDINDLLYDYGSNLMQYIEGSPLNALTTYDNKVVGIPSVIDPYKFGILVRKDYMEACGYTDDPAKAQQEFKAGQNYELVDNLETFKEMCLKINTLTHNTYAVSGAAWDLEKVLVLGAYTDSGYFSSTIRNYDGLGEVIIPGYATDEYKDVLAMEYDWAMTGVTSKEANSILLEAAESAFISGNTGVFVQDPTIQHLITVARKTKISNPNAEFTVLGPLRAYKNAADCPKDESGQPKKGFMRNTKATFAATILNKSKNAVAIIKFLNWVFGSVDNYNLCRYGIEGQHWVNNGDNTYSYPAGKESYITAPPYSGILTLVENQNISNLTYDGYTAEEKEWLELAKTPDNYVENDLIDYLLPSNAVYWKTEYGLQKNMYDALFVKAWTGAADPLRVENGAVVFDSLVSNYRNGAKEQLIYKMNAYNIMKNRFSSSAEK